MNNPKSIVISYKFAFYALLFVVTVAVIFWRIYSNKPDDLHLYEKSLNMRMEKLQMQNSSALNTLRKLQENYHLLNKSIQDTIQYYKTYHENNARDIIANPVNRKRSSATEQRFWENYKSGYYTDFED